MCPLEAVIFDLDGVLTETSRQHFMAWKQLARTLGYELPSEVNERLKGVSRMDSLEVVLKQGGMADTFTAVEKQELANQKNMIYLSLISQFTRGNLYEGALELLISLKKNGIRLGLASASKNAPFLLKAMNIEEYFDAVADPNKIKHGKPAPDIFLLSAEMLGVEPRSCIGIEDAFVGIEAIKAAGMTAVGIGSNEVLYNCDTVVSGLADLNIEYLSYLIKDC
jgi:beta-phosphoglucomutase